MKAPAPTTVRTPCRRGTTATSSRFARSTGPPGDGTADRADRMASAVVTDIASGLDGLPDAEMHTEPADRRLRAGSRLPGLVAECRGVRLGADRGLEFLDAHVTVEDALDGRTHHSIELRPAASPQRALGDAVVGQTVKEGLVVDGWGEGQEVRDSLIADPAGDVGPELRDHPLDLGIGQGMDD